MPDQTRAPNPKSARIRVQDRQTCNMANFSHSPPFSAWDGPDAPDRTLAFYRSTVLTRDNGEHLEAIFGPPRSRSLPAAGVGRSSVLVSCALSVENIALGITPYVSAP